MHFTVRDSISRFSFYLAKVIIRPEEIIAWQHVRLASLSGLPLCFQNFHFFSLFIIIASRALCKIGHSHHLAVSPLAPTKLINYD